MFVRYRSQAFILKKNGQGEANQLLTVYTKKFGKIKVLAKASRKISSKLRPFVELFCLSEIEFIQGKNYKTLTDAILIDSFKNLRKDFKKLFFAFKISDIFDKLVKGEESDGKIWRLLKETFQYLNELKAGSKAEKLEIIYYYFFWNFLSLLGYRPELYDCFQCRKKLIPTKNYFSPEQGGIVCQNCFKKVILEKREISLEIIKILRIILACSDFLIENLDMLEKKRQTLFKLKIEKIYLEELKEISNYYFSEISKQN